jgi:hypothetical protein
VASSSPNAHEFKELVVIPSAALHFYSRSKASSVYARNDEFSAHECIGSFSEFEYNDFVSSTSDVIPFHFLLIQNLEEGQEHQHVLDPADDKNYYVS